MLDCNPTTTCSKAEMARQPPFSYDFLISSQIKQNRLKKYSTSYTLSTNEIFLLDTVSVCLVYVPCLALFFKTNDEYEYE